MVLGITLAERKNFVPFITANGIQTLNTLEAILVLPENIVNPIKIKF